MNNQSGESWIMPIKVQWCKVDISNEESKKNLLKWLDEYDNCNNPHNAVYVKDNVTKYSSSNEIYINHIGLVREASYLVAYQDPYYGYWKVQVSSYKGLPLMTADKIHPNLFGYFYNKKYQEALKVIKERITTDTKAHKEFEKSQKKNR